MEIDAVLLLLCGLWDGSSRKSYESSSHHPSGWLLSLALRTVDAGIRANKLVSILVLN